MVGQKETGDENGGGYRGLYHLKWTKTGHLIPES